MKKLFILIGFVACTHCVLNAQVRISYNNKNKIDNSGNFQKAYQDKRILIPDFNIEKLLKNEKKLKTRSETSLLETFRFAELVSINLNVVKEMSWINDLEFEYGKLSIISKSAKSLSANFDRFYLPAGSEMFIYNENGNTIAGPITYLENNSLKTWASSLYKGGYFTLEIKIPHNKKGELELNISTLAYGYKEILFQLVGGFGQAGACNVNVVCPDGNGWESERNSVGLALLSNGTTATSGSLLMNTCNTSNPYFLTADHSYLADQNIANWQFIFQAWSAACSPSQNSDGVTFYGASLISHWNQSDFCLLKLNQTPPANSNINFAGWNRNITPATNGTMIHHPHGDVMKISKCFQQLYRVPIGVGGNSVDYWQANWDVGDAEPGSSGAPIFDQNHRVVGQASSGPGTTCAGPLRAYFGCIDLSWNGGGTPATRLKDWLDPTNSGAMTTNTTNVANLNPPIESLLITGADNFCGSTSTYSLNVPTGTTVSWQSSNPNIATITPNGNPATVTRLLDGVVTITATVSSCGTNISTTKEIVLGAPQIEMVNFTNDVGGQGYWCSTHYNNLFSVEPTYLQSATFEARLLNYPSMTVFRTNSNANTGTDPFGYVPSGWYILQLRTTNACGPSMWYETEIEYVDCFNQGGGGENFRVTVSPNPTDGDLNVTIDKEKETVKALSKTEKLTFQLYNFNRTSIVRQWTFDNSQNSHNLNVRGLSSGQYVLLVTKGKFRQSTQIIIK